MNKNKSIRITDEMEGKVCLVTGGSRGIGFHIARGLAMMGGFVVLASHDRQRGERASRKINAFVLKRRTDFMLVDLSSQDEIHKFTGEVQEKYGHLDVLVNNAGGFFLKRRESVDGIEMTFALNHLNYFLTTHLLLDTLLVAESPRIVNVASEAHRRAKMHFEDLQFENGYSGLRAYKQSKLANLLFTYQLARRLADTPATVNALHPGFVNTQLGKQNKLVRFVMDGVHDLFAKSPEQGAKTALYLATSPQVEGVTGEYFINKAIVPSSPKSYDNESSERLWEISEKLCGLTTGQMQEWLPTYDLADTR